MADNGSRRHFLERSAVCAAGAAVLPSCWAARSAGADANLPAASHLAAASASPPPLSASRRIGTAVKWGMIETGGPAADKFQLCKELGLDGMELVSPVAGFSIDEAVAASRASGMPIHGVVDMKHWDVRLSSADDAVRAQGVAILDQALRDAHALGGSSVLLVPGKVNGAAETHDHVWRRSIEGIRQVLPTASHVGVRVLIETVWNGFCETPEQMRDYLDEIASPWVASYFDIGNVLKFSPPQNWIRMLGPRIVKLDCKDWSATKGFCKIGDGAVDWAEVRKALDEVGYTGWCTAEVAGGGRDELADVARRMREVLGLVGTA